MNRLHIALLLAALLVGCSRSDTSAQSGTELTAADIEANNRGVALMGYFDYERARATFAELVERRPDWRDAQINLAIATLNRQQQGDETVALAIVERVLVDDPNNARANYVTALLRLNAGEADAAYRHFQRVADSDREDAYAEYYSALCLAQQDRLVEAAEAYTRAATLDPYLRSAYYGAFQTLRRLGRTDEAQAQLDAFQKLDGNPRARLAEFKYTRMGPKGEAQVVNLGERSSIPLPDGPVFDPPRSLMTAEMLELSPEKIISVTVADFQADERPELYIPGVLAGDAKNAVLLAEGEGYFLNRDHPLAQPSGVNAALWGDYDNDGFTDVYLLRSGPNQLWRQQPRDTWRDVTAESQTAGGQLDSTDGALFDADHDGDLDIFVLNSDGPNELLNNNLDGTFRPLAQNQGLAGSGGASSTIITGDLDGDRDADIVIVNREPPHEVYLNDRLWAYRAAPGVDALVNAPMLSAVGGDADVDGKIEIYALEADGSLVRWEATPTKTWARDVLIDGVQAPSAPAQLMLIDLDGDHAQDLVYSSGDGWSVVRLEHGNESTPMYSSDGAVRAWAPLVLDSQRGAGLVQLSASGLEFLPPGSGRHAFLGLSVSGLEDHAESMRSNASGIGTRINARIGSEWVGLSTFRQHSGPGQSLQPIAVGLGGAAKIDYVALNWSDGVFQTELDLEPGKLYEIQETQRQLSSCPVLFAWDGERFDFVSDLLGVAGVGFNLTNGVYSTPRPWENFLIPDGGLAPKDGRLILKLTEPMEEVAYLDSARLRVYDLPPGWHMALDERMGLSAPMPSGEPLFYRTKVLPSRAVNGRRESVLEALLERDGVAPEIGKQDRRFVGRLAKPFVLELGFARPLDSGTGAAVLLAEGWVEYPYSQTGFAAWQADARFEAPSLEAHGSDGRWHMVAEHFGYPAGMPRSMMLPLADLPEGTTALRLSTNLQVYWDRIAVAFVESPDAVRAQELALVRAELREVGYPKRVSLDQRRPQFDYANRVPLLDTRYPQGFYTEFGEATELVTHHDDALAIVGPGEEIHLEFESSATPPNGWNRYYVLETNGWTKDMDMYTRTGGWVAPLPVTGKPPAVRDSLHARYNTRFRAGY